MQERIYLDYITASPVSQNAIRASLPYYEEHFASPNAPYKYAQELLMPIEEANTHIYELFGAKSDEQFICTSSGAEAVAIAVHSAYSALTRLGGKNHFVARSIDEAPAILTLSSLEEEGCYLKFASTHKRGFVTKDALIEAISPRTALVSISWACALTGVIQPLEELAEVCKERAIWLHVDATHVAGKLDIAFSDLPIDILTFNGNSLHAPVGTGGLFAKKHIPIKPLTYAAPINVPMLMALGESARLAKETESLYCTEVARVKSQFEERLLSGYPEAKILFQEEERVPHISAIAFTGIHAELLAFALQRKGVYTSIGGLPFQPIEKVLTDCGIDPELARCSLAISLSKDTQEHELERASDIIIEVAKRLRRLSRGIIA